MNERGETLIQKLKASGCRLTPQRMAVVRALAEAGEEHPTAEEVFARVRKDFPTTSLATIYKTIAMLKSVGEVRELDFGSRGSRFDASKPYPHPHIICTRCGAIHDPEFADLPMLAQRAAALSGYNITDARLDFFGICPQCQGTN